MIGIPLATTPMPLPGAWQDANERTVRPLHRDTPLLEAFCDGAGLDVSSLAGEEPAELMRCLGAIYQQTIVGLSTLLSERTRLKADKQLDRTTIGAVDNNPLKWAPTRRLGRDLLSEENEGFLTGPDAVRAAFEDLADHMAGTAAGANAAIEAVLTLFDPAAIEDEAAEYGFSLKSRAGLSWDIHSRRHRSVRKGEQVEHAFRDAYNRASRQDSAG
jgi:type VI secretion system FHA domain protein